MWVCVCHVSAVPSGARRGHWIPELELEQEVRSCHMRELGAEILFRIMLQVLLIVEVTLHSLNTSFNTTSTDGTFQLFLMRLHSYEIGNISRKVAAFSFLSQIKS